MGTKSCQTVINCFVDEDLFISLNEKSWQRGLKQGHIAEQISACLREKSEKKNINWACVFENEVKLWFVNIFQWKLLSSNGDQTSTKFG